MGINNISGYNSLSIKTGSGDISLSHKNTPESLTYDVSSGSGDITLKLENLNPPKKAGNRWQWGNFPVCHKRQRDCGGEIKI